MRQLTISKQITNRETQSLDKYFVEISKMDLISADMEAVLAKRIREGDTVALEKLTKANLRFVVSVAKQYQNQGLSLNDLINEGNLGLIKAGQRFDETRGFKFISYAVWWIRQSIMQALMEQTRMVRLPLNRVGSINRINKMFAKLEQEFQREPSAEEVADALSISAEQVRESMKAAAKHLSMDSPFQQGEDGSLQDYIADDSSKTPDGDLLTESLVQDIESVLSHLSEREADVLVLSFGLKGTTPHTLEEIGEKFNVSSERIRQLREKALSQMRRMSRNHHLKSFI